ncbi:MAG: uncharacterized protein KVP18_000945 [Porospora cf. gigantea A]|uniref:uncharacterized protein n=1 Tax=Porospora cf. gigantea A TaxID=2853593 RepID=UPI00355A9911|nr:MAG: hypothetical protein KVP18_000945 [Porospora cf. gigantea A]
MVQPHEMEMHNAWAEPAEISHVIYRVVVTAIKPEELATAQEQLSRGLDISKESVVRRWITWKRFAEFVSHCSSNYQNDLYTRIAKAVPTLPSLPGKTFIRQFDISHVHDRRIRLHRWLSNLAHHRDVRGSNAFRDFADCARGSDNSEPRVVAHIQEPSMGLRAAAMTSTYILTASCDFSPISSVDSLISSWMRWDAATNITKARLGLWGAPQAFPFRRLDVEQSTNPLIPPSVASRTPRISCQMMLRQTLGPITLGLVPRGDEEAGFLLEWCENLDELVTASYFCATSGMWFIGFANGQISCLPVPQDYSAEDLELLSDIVHSPSLGPLGPIPAHCCRIAGMHFNDGVLFSAGRDTEVRVYCCKTCTLVCTHSVCGPVYSMSACRLGIFSHIFIGLRDGSVVVLHFDHTTRSIFEGSAFRGKAAFHGVDDFFSPHSCPVTVMHAEGGFRAKADAYAPCDAEHALLITGDKSGALGFWALENDTSKVPQGHQGLGSYLPPPASRYDICGSLTAWIQVYLYVCLEWCVMLYHGR